MRKFSELNIKPEFPLVGEKVSITTLYGATVILERFKKMQVNNEDVWQLQFKYRPDDLKTFVTFTRSNVLGSQLLQVEEKLLPVEVTIRNENGYLFFE